jgi:hypothetical protein
MRTRNRHLTAGLSAAAMFASVLALTSVSSATNTRTPHAATSPCTTPAAKKSDKHDHGQHEGDGQQPDDELSLPSDCDKKSNGRDRDEDDNEDELGVISDSCDDSLLLPHDGFQKGNRCVSTEFGEVGEAENNPSLFIVSAPRQVAVDEPFTILVSTRNLVRDRFLPAGEGGYYKERSILDEDGIVHGHFHAACRELTSRRTAPDPAPRPDFFLAVEDGGGGAEPDEVAVRVSGLPDPGLYQCAVWAGDGSHRMPMMERADQIPAFDAVRIVVTEG